MWVALEESCEPEKPENPSHVIRYGCEPDVDPEDTFLRTFSLFRVTNITLSLQQTNINTMGPIANMIMRHRQKREIKKLEKEFAPDCEIIIAEDTTMSLEDYFAAEAALFASFPDLTIDYDVAALEDATDDGVVAVDATVTGTFTGADYVYGDHDAIVATGAALSKETVYTMTFVDGKVTKFVVVGFDPLYVYETLAASD